MRGYSNDVYNKLAGKYPWEHEFLQAALEVLESLAPLMDREAPATESIAFLSGWLNLNESSCFVSHDG